jgi:hypothetical protein
VTDAGATESRRPRQTPVRTGTTLTFFFKDRDGGDDLPVRGEPWGLLFDKEDGFRRDPAETAPPRDLEQEIRDLGSDGAWRTLKEWKLPKSKGGLGVGEEKLRTVIGRLVDVGELEFKQGPQGRSPTAGCWRLKVPRGGQGTSGHPDPPTGEEGAGASVPRPYIEAGPEAGHPADSNGDSNRSGHITEEEVERLLAKYPDLAGGR